MSFRVVRVCVFFAVCIASLLSGDFAQAAGGTPVYNVLQIPIPAGWSAVVAKDINNFGEIVGYGVNGTSTRPFIASSSTFQSVPLPNAQFTGGFGLSINGYRQIAGWGPYVAAFPQTIPYTQVFAGGPAVTTQADAVTGPYNVAYDINDIGQVAGSVFLNTAPPRVFRAYIGTVSGARSLINAVDWRDTLARSINNYGRIAGVGVYNPTGAPQVFTGDLTGISPVAVPPGWSPVLPAYDDTTHNVQINDIGQTVATVALPPGSGIVRVAMLSGGGSFIIPPPGGYDSANQPALNNIGTVVGYLVGATGGWIWSAATGTRLLQDLVPPEWTILGADGINDKGQIVAQARNTRGFIGPVILDPVPVNSTPPVPVNPTPSVPVDSTAPVISGMPAQCSVWPPNGKYVRVAVINATDNGSGLATFRVTGHSNAPYDGGIMITGGPDGYSVYLQAERGRRYDLTATASDLAGNATDQQTTCSVPISWW